MKRLVTYSLIALMALFPALVGAAPNKIMIVPGTRITFQDSGGTAVATFQNLATGAGQYSARYDKNALVTASGAMPHLWTWDVTVRLAATATTGDVIEVYVVKSNGTQVQGALGTTTASLATDKRKNLTFVGTVVLDANPAATGVDYTASGSVEIRERYFSVALWNATTQNLVNTANINIMGMTPMNLEIQASVPTDYDKRTHPPVLAVA